MSTFKAPTPRNWKLQENIEIITNHKLQFWTKIPKTGYCDVGGATFKAPTPRNWKLKTAESIRVVLFRKYDQKLVSDGLKDD